MSAPVSPTKGSESKEAEGAPRPCPASCEASILYRDSHPLCITCMGTTQASLIWTEKVVERRSRVVANASGQGPHPSYSRPSATSLFKLGGLDGGCWSVRMFNVYRPLVRISANQEAKAIMEMSRLALTSWTWTKWRKGWTIPLNDSTFPTQQTRLHSSSGGVIATRMSFESKLWQNWNLGHGHQHSVLALWTNQPHPPADLIVQCWCCCSGFFNQQQRFSWPDIWRGWRGAVMFVSPRTALRNKVSILTSRLKSKGTLHLTKNAKWTRQCSGRGVIPLPSRKRVLSSLHRDNSSHSQW